jgi:hypothetical protein
MGEVVTFKPIFRVSVPRGVSSGEQAVDWITDDVAIGNYLEALDATLLTRHGFRSALSLDGTLTEQQLETR